MKKALLPPHFFLIACLCLNIVVTANNITLNCKVSSCSSDKDVCGVVCDLPNDLEHTSDYIEVQGYDLKDLKLKHIPELRLNPADMTKYMPKKIGEHFKQLEKFEVTSSKLMFIERKDFVQMEALKWLNLANNKIEYISSDTFNNLTNLEVLYLYSNRIPYLKPHTLDKLVNLREFHVDMNKIERLEMNFFLNNKKIEKISLNDNQLTSINENFTAYSNLEYVDLRRNFRMCHACEVMEDSAQKERFNACERERHEDQEKIKKRYVECAKKKVSEKDEHLKKFNTWEATKESKLKEISNTFDKCLAFKRPITLNEIKEADNCIFQRIRNEVEALNNMVRSIEDEGNRDKAFKDLMTMCGVERTKENSKMIEDYSSCTYCKVMANPNSIRMCELKFVRDNGDNIEEFDRDVKIFFPKGRI